RRGERLPGPREEMLPERPAAADLVLPQPRLRLVDAQRRGRAERGAGVLGRQVLLVETVPGFVQDAEEGLVEEPRVVAGGDPTVADAWRLSATIFSSHGRKRAKSLPWRASCQTPWACEVTRASSSTSSLGSLTARSWPRRISRTFAATSESESRTSGLLSTAA